MKELHVRKELFGRMVAAVLLAISSLVLNPQKGTKVEGEMLSV